PPPKNFFQKKRVERPWLMTQAVWSPDLFPTVRSFWRQKALSRICFECRAVAPFPVQRFRKGSSLMGILRKTGSWLIFSAVIAAGNMGFDWVDYHVKGKAPIWGLNPRCIEQFYGDCRKLDTTNMTWDATIAVWLDRGVWFLIIAFMVLGGVTLLISAVIGV